MPGLPALLRSHPRHHEILPVRMPVPGQAGDGLHGVVNHGACTPYADAPPQCRSPRRLGGRVQCMYASGREKKLRPLSKIWYELTGILRCTHAIQMCPGHHHPGGPIAQRHQCEGNIQRAENWPLRVAICKTMQACMNGRKPASPGLARDAGGYLVHQVCDNDFRFERVCLLSSCTPVKAVESYSSMTL